MRFFLIFMAIIGFFVLVFAVSLFFPHQYRIERSTVVNRPVTETFTYLNNIRNWKDWSPWNTDLDSSFVSFYSRNPVGVEARQYFRGGLVGIGRLRISESIPNEKIHFDLSINEGAMTSEASFYFSPVGSRTKLTWIDEGDVGYNPVFRFMLPSKITATENAFEQGLISIKHAAEAHQAP